MGISVVVREVVIDEVNAIAALFNEYRMFYEQESNLDGARAFLLERFIHRDSVIFAAAVDDQFVGFTQLYPTYSSISMQKSWILNDLYVRESYRGAGVGKLLLDQAKEYAQLTLSKGIELSTAVDNFTAQRLYENHGYVKDTSFCHYSLKI